MTGHDFIFSNKKSIRIFRHLVFWLICWLYGSLTYYFVQQNWVTPSLRAKYVNPGTFVLIKTFLLILVYTIPCYAFIYSILPALVNRKWMKVVLFLVPLMFLMYGMGWFMYWKLFPFIDSLFGLPGQNQYLTKFWPAVVLGLIDPLKIIAAAAIIKYVKHWWIQQNAKEKLEQEKWNAELQLLKAKISPNFLFTSLDNIYKFALASSPETPELLMKLSDLLNYMVYDCEAHFVPLEKELERMKDFIMLEKLSLNNDLETGMTVTGDVKDKVIAPFLLLPFIESSFKKSSRNSEQPWVNIEISITDTLLIMKVAGSTEPSNEGKKTTQTEELTNVQKRLSLLYPQKHELKISWESEMFIVHLKIRISHVLEKSEVLSKLSLI